jgi:hypothetical protein
VENGSYIYCELFYKGQERKIVCLIWIYTST